MNVHLYHELCSYIMNKAVISINMTGPLPAVAGVRVHFGEIPLIVEH